VVNVVQKMVREMKQEGELQVDDLAADLDKSLSTWDETRRYLVVLPDGDATFKCTTNC